MGEAPRKSVGPHGRGRYDWWIVGGVLAALAAGLVIAARNGEVAPVAEPVCEAKSQAALQTATRTTVDIETETIDDDGRTQWASPTDGTPLELANLPPGVQVILAVRPKAILAHPEAEKVLAALGPLGNQAVIAVESAAGRPLEDIEQMLIGWQVDRDGKWQATVLSLNSLGSAPPLARDMERLVAHTDASRHITLLFRPSFLFGDNNSIFDGPMAGLREPLFWFFGDGLNAAALSLHWDENFFVELVGVPTLDVPTDRMANELKTRVNEMPDRVEEFVVGLDPSPHSRRVVARFPGMVRKFAAYTRTNFDRDVVELRAYLPAVAGHNLVMGAELTLAEARGDGNSPPAEAGSPGGESSIEDRLQVRTSLRFSRDTLETALRMLSQDAGVPIVIRGPDLQSEGITKNQSFGIDVSDRPAGGILVEVLRLANPDKLATGPVDQRQKLVYVVGRESPGGPEVVFVTTRTRAQERGETLPAVFGPTQ